LKARAVTDETSKANDDLNNFIASTSIATIFVDQGLHIKRYTPRATGIFNLIPVNIGRSLLDITHRLTYPKLTDDATSTFASLSPVEREVSSNDGRFYISRMLPYRTGDNRIRGVVLTFIDIISSHLAEEKVRAGERRIQLFAESTKDYAIMTADADWRITSWNKGAERMLRRSDKNWILFTRPRTSPPAYRMRNGKRRANRAGQRVNAGTSTKMEADYSAAGS
jgi:two-component system CheB/CheR fusion protein